MSEQDWQPISSCPCGYDGHRFHYVLFWGVSRGRSFAHPVVVSGFMGSDGEPVQHYGYKLRITHWREHLDPPVAEGSR